MALSGICLRQDKGSTLTIQELDNNFRILTGSVEDFQDGTTPSCGACTVSVLNTNVNQTRYLTFVDGTSGFRRISTDSDTLTYAPCTNLLSIGTTDYNAPAKIKLISSGSIGGVSTTLQAPTATTGDTVVCFPLGSGTVVVDKVSNTFTGVNTFTSTVCLGNAVTDIITTTGSLNVSGSLCVDGCIVGSITCAETVRAQATTEAVVHEIPFVNYTTDGQYGLCVRSTVTFNPNSNELRTFGICGCSYICGGNVQGNFLCSGGAVCSATVTTSGNAILGNAQSDTHQITGSLNISGSINSSDNIFPVVLQFGKSGAVYNTGGSFTGGYTEYFVDTAGGANTCNNDGYYFGYKGEISKISLTGRFLAGCAKEEGIRAYPTINGVVQTSMYAEIPDDEIPDIIAGGTSNQASIDFTSPKYLGAVIRVAGGDDGNLGTVCGTDYSVTLFVKTRSF